MTNEQWGPEEEERLRRALQDEAARVHPSPDGLDRILARTRASRWTTWRRNPAVLGLVAASAVAVLVVGAVLTMMREPPDESTTSLADAPLATTSPDRSPSPTPTPAPQRAEPTAPPEPAEPDVETLDPPLTEEAPEQPPEPHPDEPPPGVAVPVYYLSEAPDGLRLAREWRHAETTGSPAEQALALLFGEAETDGYVSPWDPATEVTSVRVGSGLITVDLAAPDGTPLLPGEHADLAVQGLVYTVTGAVSATTDIDRALPVRILVDGERAVADRLGAGVDLSGPVSRAPALEVRKLVQVNDPAHGATVRSPVQVTGEAAAFEATVVWEVLRDGEVVDEGHTTAEECCRFARFSFDLDLEPGTYTLAVSDTDPSDGEGPGPTTDTRTFSVTN